MSAKKTTKTKAKKPSGVAKTTETHASKGHDAPKGSRGGSDEDRTGRRVPIQLLVDYKSGGNYLFDFCKDLGAGGVFIQTDKPLPAGSPIDLTFTIPDSKETLITKGTVIWVQGEVQERSDLTPGMGVQFKGFSGDQRRLLEDFVQRYHGHRTTIAPTTPTAGKRAG
jgi:type IV pilus assembly protein PilZ